MLKQRVITALILVAIVLADLFASNPIYWRGLITIVVFLGFFEWLRFCKIRQLAERIVAYGLFTSAVILFQAGYVDLNLVVPIVCLMWLLLLLFTFSEKINIVHFKWCKVSIGIIALSAAGWIVIEIKNIANGPLWIVCFLGAVAAADIGAYFVGRRFGKTKLAPTISPGKTVEGFLGGLALVALIYIPVLFYLFPLLDAALLLVTVLVTSVVSVGGDLFESKLKRHVGLKDSSQILPGHGGILDRIDSILAGAPFFSLGLLWLQYLG